MRIRQGAPGVSCSPAMKPSLSQRWMVEGATLEDLGGAGDRRPARRRAARRAAGGAGCFQVAAQAADDDLGGEALAGGGAAALAVEDAGDRGVVVVDGEAAEQRDRVLVGADRGLVAWAAGRRVR